MTYPIWPELLEPWGRAPAEEAVKDHRRRMEVSICIETYCQESGNFVDVCHMCLGVPVWIGQHSMTIEASSFDAISALAVIIPYHLESENLLSHVFMRRRLDACLIPVCK